MNVIASEHRERSNLMLLKIGIASSAFGLLAMTAIAAEKPVLYDPPKPMIVKVDVADVRSEPVRHNLKYEYDAKQETQVLKGERVNVYEKRGKWVRVEVPGQIEFTHANKWQGYPGWIEEKFLTDDMSQEKIITEPKVYDDDLRRQILMEARRHIGTRYLWGGRSIHDPKLKKTVSGVDCSGLVSWSYERVGMILPRDSHEQSLRARKLEQSELKPADLIFYAKADKPEKIVHVALYVGDGMMLEAPQTGELVRETPLRLSDAERVVTFGTYFPEAQ